jgi:hypothetical protein
MEKKLEAARSEPGNKGKAENIQQVDFTTKTAKSQRQIILAHLLTHGSITTLEGRNELYIMGIAARIWELKHEQGHPIITTMVPAVFGSKRMIARYTLLAKVQS